MYDSLDRLAEAMDQLRRDIETGVVDSATAALQAVFVSAESALYEKRDLLSGLQVGASGGLVPSVENITTAHQILAEVRTTIDTKLAVPGKAWTQTQVGAFHRAGRQLARLNLDVSWVSPELVQSIFANVQASEQAVLRVGFERGYRIMNTVGDDVVEWFERTMLDAVIEGIPVVDKAGGDSLTKRLYEGNRLKPHTVKTADGKLIHRSLKQRAEAIARFESGRIVNRTHEILGFEALGEEMVGVNRNPLDERTTTICNRASRRRAMSKKAWQDSEFGLPPRANPFHLCRSFILWGLAAWFEQYSYPKAA